MGLKEKKQSLALLHGDCCELKTLPGTGYACQIEQPWLFGRFIIEFLTKHGLFPEATKPAKSID